MSRLTDSVKAEVKSAVYSKAAKSIVKRAGTGESH